MEYFMSDEKKLEEELERLKESNHCYRMFQQKVQSTLGNNKALLSTNIVDGTYYEITYDNNCNTFYFDAYKKWSHQEYQQ